MLPNTILDKENIDYVFKVFAQKLNELGYKKKLNVFVVGGGAIVLNFDYRLSTIDIDAEFELDETVKEAIKRVAKDLQLPDDWLNSDFINTPSYSFKIKSVSKLVKTYSEIVFLFSLPCEYLIAMKLKSSRPTGGDLDDIIKMIYELRIKGVPISYEMIISSYNYLYDNFDNTYSYFIEKTKEAFDADIDEVRLLMSKGQY